MPSHHPAPRSSSSQSIFALRGADRRSPFVHVAVYVVLGIIWLLLGPVNLLLDTSHAGLPFALVVALGMPVALCGLALYVRLNVERRTGTMDGAGTLALQISTGERGADWRRHGVTSWADLERMLKGMNVPLTPAMEAMLRAELRREGIND